MTANMFVTTSFAEKLLGTVPTVARGAEPINHVREPIDPVPLPEKIRNISVSKPIEEA